MGNAILNIVFNASTAILFGFFLAPFTKMVEWFVPIKQDDIRLRIEQAQMSKKWIDFSLAQVYALHEDSKMLINQVFAYNSSAFGFDRKILTDKASTIEDILNKTISWNNKEQVIQYDKLKHTSDIMLEYLLPAKTQKLHSKDRILLDQIEATIYANTQSAKSIKNICQDIQDISSSKNKTMKVLAKKILSTAAVFYKHVANIIDKDYDKKNFEELTESLRNIKKDHQHFIGYLTEEITSKLSKEELEELNIPTLLNLDQYLYQSAKKLVTALQNTYLEAEEEKVFKKLKMVEEG